MTDTETLVVKALRQRNLKAPYTGKHLGMCDTAADLIERLARERDAAIHDLYKAASCETCALQEADECLLNECMDSCSTFGDKRGVPYKWRGHYERPQNGDDSDAE